MVTRERLYTAEEFWQFDFEESKRYELIEGEIVEMAPSKPVNSITAARILAAVLNFVDAHDLGYVQGADGGYTLSPNTVRIPDVSFISKARVPEIPSEFVGGPDLAIEVISASESSQDVIKKVRMYFAAGTKLVWAFYPEDEMVYVYRPTEDGFNVQPIDINGTLDGEDVLPGFSLPVKQIFKK